MANTEDDEQYDIGLLASMMDADDDNNLNEFENIDKNSTRLALASKNALKEANLNSVSQASNVSMTTADLEMQLKDLQQKMALLQQQLLEKKKADSQLQTPPPLLDRQKSFPVAKLRDVGLAGFLDRPSTSAGHGQAIDKKCDSKKSVVHEGDTDSSESESNCDPTSTKDNEFGSFVRQRLAHTPKYEVRPETRQPDKRLKPMSKPNGSTLESEKSVETMDSYSGIRIINPKVSSTEMRERMTGRRMIQLSAIRMNSRSGEIEGDWVTIGVIVIKTEPKKSAKGSLYSIWKLCDLRDCSKIVSLFLFGKNHEQHWKTAVGSVVGLLNATIMPDKDSQNGNGNELCLTIDHPQKLMLMGVSKDFGQCKGRRKDGAACTMFVNKADCEFCPFHVQKAYRKSSSKRMDLQASFSGPEPNGLRMKALQKQEVIYGGRLYVNLAPEKPGKKLMKNGKDRLTLDNLKLQKKAADLAKTERAAIVINAAHLSSKENKIANNIVGEQREAFGKMLCVPTAGSRNLFKHLCDEDNIPKGSDDSPVVQMKSVTPSELLKIHAQQMETKRASGQLSAARRSVPTITTDLTPRLGRGLQPGETVLLDVSSSTNYAQMKALKTIGKPITKKDPNAIRPERNGTKFREKIKRKLEEESREHLAKEPLEKKRNVDTSAEEKIKEIMNRKSKYDDLVVEEDCRRQDKYFTEMEKKEQIETKMCSTTEVQCRAVSCKKCGYTAFSALETCRTRGHRLVVHKATKRYFKCKDCSRRTVSLSKLPTKPCRGCKGMDYERVAMCKERGGPTLDSERLSIRGGERTFVDSHCTENLNL